MSLGGLLYDAVYETIITGPWKEKLQPSALQTLPVAAEQAADCWLVGQSVIEEKQAPVQTQTPLEPPAPAIADTDVFGWLK